MFKKLLELLRRSKLDFPRLQSRCHGIHLLITAKRYMEGTIARAIQPRPRVLSASLFVSVNSAAIPREPDRLVNWFGAMRRLLSKETGATQRRLGRLRLAERGTIFLTNLGSPCLTQQIAVCVFLQDTT